MAPILVTGAAGFIGSALTRRLLREGETVVGLDNLNAYYDPALKRARLETLTERNFRFVHGDLVDRDLLNELCQAERFKTVVHLAAQAGVRHSLSAPHSYAESNVTGFLNVLEACRHHEVGHLLYASSSSVYGAAAQKPFSIHQNVDHPLSFYAATKKANELMAHSYSHLYRLPTTGLRFFTVYGPWGRPDMAVYLFTKAILDGVPIKVFNHGDLERDFTFIDDIVEMVWRLMARPPQPNPAWNDDRPDPASSRAPYRLFNLGNNKPVALRRLIAVIEDALGAKAICDMLPMQPGDVPSTYADIDQTIEATGFVPQTSIETGVEAFVDWYRRYYRV